MADPTVVVNLQIPGATPGTYSASVVVTAAVPPTPPPIPPVPIPVPAAGVWVNVTPPGINLTAGAFGNDNYGELPLVVDPARPTDVYMGVAHQGIWKSTDTAQSFQGPINTGTGGSLVTAGKPWALAIATNPANPSGPPMLFTAAGNAAVGAIVSLDGGVSWAAYKVNNATALAASGNSYFQNDVYSYAIDPADATHILCGMHGFPGISESLDGAKTWRTVPVPAGIGTSLYPYFVPGSRSTWLTVAQWNGNTEGIWHTTDSGNMWVQVATIEHFHGSSQLAWESPLVAQIGGVDKNGAAGIFKTADGGLTWTRVSTINSNGVVATPAFLYSSMGSAVTTAGDPCLQVASRTNDTAWTKVTAPAGMTNGWKQAAVTTGPDGLAVVVAGCYLAGVWRYAEPSSTPPVPVPPVPSPPTPTPGVRPALHVNGSALNDTLGNRVILRGVSSQGMGMVYGDKANPGTYLPVSITDYVKRAVQVDGQGQPWNSTAIRLCFERFPCTDPTRLYTVENVPYAMPDTIAFPAWQPSTNYATQEIATAGGNRYRVIQRKWRADRGQAWNPGAYIVGDVVSAWDPNAGSHVYQCTAVPATPGPVPTNPSWSGGPTQAAGSSTDIFGNVWLYIGEFGTSGTTPLQALTPITDDGQQYLVDGLVSWQYDSPDYTPAQALANFQDWKSKVMDPAITAAKAAGLYVIICNFDFGPAHHPLMSARLTAFWTLMAQSQWANDPQVLFELWNESCDVDGISGGPGSWAAQKPVIQGVVNTIRATANNVILVPPPFFSAWVGEATASPLTGTNIAYTLHQYRSQYEAFTSNQQQITQGLASGQAIFMTEWGDDTNPTDSTKTWWDASSATPLKALIEPSLGSLHPVCGWTAWSLSPSWSPDLFTDNALTLPTPYGQAVRVALFNLKADSQPVG